MKKINNILITLSILTAILSTFLFKDITLITILQLVIFSICMLFPLRINNNLRLIYLIFIDLAFFLGVILNLYHIIYWYDSFVHFIFGFITSLVAILILNKFKYNNKWLFTLIFLFITNLAIAVSWELIEFSIDKIFNLDIQKVAKTGVNDTIKDVICALLANLLFIIFYFNNTKRANNFIGE